MEQRINLRSPFFVQHESLPAESQSTNLATYSESFTSWSLSGVSITQNSIKAPSLENTGVKFVSNANNWRANFNYSATSGVNYTISIYAKLDLSTSTESVKIESYTGAGGLSAVFNLSTKTITSSTYNDTFIEDVGNDWYRIGGSYISTGTSNIMYVYPSVNLGVAGTVFFWGAQIEQGELSSYIKNATTPQTRSATTETQEEPVEAEIRIWNGIKGYHSDRTNLISESIDFTEWGDTGVTVTPNYASSPIGDNTASRLVSSASNWRRNKLFTTVSGTTNTVSVYAKLDSSSSTVSVKLEVFRGVSSASGTFNLSTGDISGSLTNTFIQYINDGWYRIGGSYTSNQASNLIYLYPSSGYGTAGSSLFWGFQAESGDTSTSFIKTEGSTVTIDAYDSDSPLSPTYTLTAIPSNGKTTFEVSDLIRDYINQTTSSYTGSAWVEITLKDGVKLPEPRLFLATEGYLLNSEGVQSRLTANSSQRFLQSNNTVIIPNGEHLMIPTYSTYDSYYTLTTNGVEGSNNVFSDNDNSNSQIDRIRVSSLNDSIKLYVDSVLVDEIKIVESECSKYSVNELLFVNKLGAKQSLYFNMKSVESIRIKESGFNRSTVNYSTMQNNKDMHGYKKTVTESKESYVLNSPFLDEGNVQAIEELLLSEYVWLKVDGGDYLPVIIKDNSMTRKTHVNDKLIQYTVNVESSFNLINNQR